MLKISTLRQEKRCYEYTDRQIHNKRKKWKGKRWCKQIDEQIEKKKENKTKQRQFEKDVKIRIAKETAKIIKKKEIIIRKKDEEERMKEREKEEERKKKGRRRKKEENR